MRQLRRWKRLWRRSLTHSHKRTSMGPSRSCWNGRTGALQPRGLLRMGLEFHVCTINESAHTKESGNLFNDPRSCFWPTIDLLWTSHLCMRIICPEIKTEIWSNFFFIGMMVRVFTNGPGNRDSIPGRVTSNT